MICGTTALHRTLEELEVTWRRWPRAARPAGKLEMIVLRPAINERATPLFAELDRERGLVGDRWFGSKRTPKAQITLMDARVCAAIAPRRDWPLFGDNFLVEMDLHEAASKPGRVLQIGSALLEITDEPHLGCKKFSARFGADALSWVNHEARRSLRMRGIHARVLRNGHAQVGDEVHWVE